MNTTFTKAAVITGIAIMVSVPGFAEARSITELGGFSAPTPYDRHMEAVRKVMNTVDSSQEAEMTRVTRLLRQARGFRYVHSTAYQPMTPAETARQRAGDCKDKSLWLINEMNTGSAYFVIGRMTGASRINHAWVYWNHGGEWYVLDPTHHSRPLRVASLRRGHYVPFYSYSVKGSHRHNINVAMNAYRGNQAAVADPQAADPAAAGVKAPASTESLPAVASKVISRPAPQVASSRKAKEEMIPAVAEKVEALAEKVEAVAVFKVDDRRTSQMAFAQRMNRLDRMHRM